MHPLFVQYCAYFNGNEDYFECHEVLEEYWKEIAPGDRQHILVGFVQLATGLYHWRRGNTNGALRTLQKAKKCLQSNSPFFDMVNQADVLQKLSKSIYAIQAGETFQAFQLTIINEQFAQLVKVQIAQLEAVPHTFLRDKHKLRDRSDIVAERLEKLSAKHKMKANGAVQKAVHSRHFGQ
ncbi:DUF309 domain-containing protein [Metasolibacillus fluoroglycofenilyticus]|uniref:DUF309 domain-containing protein n=1 Tax=Metasolibacillus fluoroglycofenilyticus TaxID=1239396 RepID=UPI000D34564B|nr:DUF309 domain-containing protein [Metasolibacillus fluoroglycofenilyticus]